MEKTIRNLTSIAIIFLVVLFFWDGKDNSDLEKSNKALKDALSQTTTMMNGLVDHIEYQDSIHKQDSIRLAQADSIKQKVDTVYAQLIKHDSIMILPESERMEALEAKSLMCDSFAFYVYHYLDTVNVVLISQKDQIDSLTSRLILTKSQLALVQTGLNLAASYKPPKWYKRPSTWISFALGLGIGAAIIPR